jgi:hypothetical protein
MVERDPLRNRPIGFQTLRAALEVLPRIEESILMKY